MKHYDKRLYNLYLKDLRGMKDTQLQYFLRIAFDMAVSYPREEARAGVNSLLDIVQNANVGLSEALIRLDKSKSEGEMVNYIKQWVDTRIKRYVFQTMSDMAISEYAIHKSKQERVADLLMKNFYYSNKMFNWKLRIKFDDYYPGTNLRYSDIAYSEPERYHETIMLGKRLIEVMEHSGLTDRDIDVMCWAYGISDYEKMSEINIAKAIGRDVRTVRRIRSRSLQVLNTEENRLILKDYM